MTALMFELQKGDVKLNTFKCLFYFIYYDFSISFGNYGAWLRLSIR